MSPGQHDGDYCRQDRAALRPALVHDVLFAIGIIRFRLPRPVPRERPSPAAALAGCSASSPAFPGIGTVIGRPSAAPHSRRSGRKASSSTRRFRRSQARCRSSGGDAALAATAHHLQSGTPLRHHRARQHAQGLSAWPTSGPTLLALTIFTLVLVSAQRLAIPQATAQLRNPRTCTLQRNSLPLRSISSAPHSLFAARQPSRRRTGGAQSSHAQVTPIANSGRSPQSRVGHLDSSADRRHDQQRGHDQSFGERLLWCILPAPASGANPPFTRAVARAARRDRARPELQHSRRDRAIELTAAGPRAVRRSRAARCCPT